MGESLFCLTRERTRLQVGGECGDVRVSRALQRVLVTCAHVARSLMFCPALVCPHSVVSCDWVWIGLVYVSTRSNLETPSAKMPFSRVGGGWPRAHHQGHACENPFDRRPKLFFEVRRSVEHNDGEDLNANSLFASFLSPKDFNKRHCDLIEDKGALHN